MNASSHNSKPELTQQSKTARTELERALSLHFQGEKAGALKALQKALSLDPTLVHDRLTSNLAREMTGLPAADALKSLVDGNTTRELIGIARKEQQRTPPMRRQRALLLLLGMLSLVFIGLVAWFISNGTLDSYLGALRIAQLQTQKANLGGYEYYVAVPSGPAPDGGWPMVVVFHGYGGNAGQMLPLAGTFNDAGAIFVAPTLGKYQPNPGNGPLEPVNRILTQVGTDYPLQARGAILLGHSQGGSFAYRYSVYYSQQVAGVVTAGAPEFDAIFPSRNIPYIFTWGALDGLQEAVLPAMVYPIQNRGFNVRATIVPGAGHELTQYAIDQALMLLKQP